MLKKEERISKLQSFMKDNYEIELTKTVIEKILDENEKLSTEDLLETGRTQTAFGNVKIAYRGERVCRNPKTQDKIIVPERLTATLSISSHLLNDLSTLDATQYKKNK